MTPTLYRIAGPFEGRLAVTARPRGAPMLRADAASWRERGIDMIVSLLEESEAAQIGLASEAECLADAGIAFLNVPIRDFYIPGDDGAVSEAVERALDCLEAGGSVAAHCFAGVGRSPMFVGAVLVRSGLDTETAFEFISAARGRPVPATGDQWQWLADYESSLPGAGVRRLS